MRGSLHFALCTAVTSIVAVSSPYEASAQTPATQVGGIGSDIVVTARRRDESLSKVPIAVSVLTGESLAKQGIRSEGDLQTSVPGLLVPQTFGSNELSYSIRGQAIDPYSGSPAAVLPYLNEFEIGSTSASTFFDLQSVQVLKGPQGTLFGRNTTGGAVLFTTVKPGDTFTGFISGLIGNFGKHQIQFGVTLPLSPIASLRVAGNYSDGGGFVRNRGYYDGVGGVGGSFVPQDIELGDNRNKSIRATLLLEPVDSLRNTMMIQHSADDGSSIPSVMSNFSPTHPLTAPFVSGQTGPFSGMAEYIAWQRRNNREVYTNGNWRNEGRNSFFINTTEVDLTDDMLIKNIVGWNRFRRDNMYDFDGMPWANFANTQTEPGQTTLRNGFSNELQLQGNAFEEAFSYTLGVFYSNVREIYDNNFLIFGNIPLRNRARLRSRSYAAFAQATYNITSDLHLTGGFRYTKDKIDLRQLPGSQFAPGGSSFSPGFEQEQNVSFKKPSWTVSLDYQVTPELLLYAAHRGSWRSGGLNYSSPPNPGTAEVSGNTFLPETTKDVELGAKFNGRLGAMPFTAAFDVYKQWISNVQKVGHFAINGVPASLTVNIPKAEVKGVEGSIALRPAPWIEIGGQLSHSTGKYTQDTLILFGNVLTYNPIGALPKWTGAAYVNLTAGLEDESSIELRADMFATSSYFYSNTAGTVTPNTEIPGYALLNGRLSWNNIMNKGFDLSAYVKNALNKRYYAGGTSSILANGADVVTFGTPRTYGMEMRFEF